MGNHTVSKKRLTRNVRGKPQDIYSFVFHKEQCVDCPHREMCMSKSKNKARKLRVALSAPMFYEKSQEQKQPEFLEKYKKRAAHEWKNAELKRFHGMSKARGFGLRSVTFQVKLTILAVNLKRIAAINSSKSPLNSNISIKFCTFFDVLELHKMWADNLNAKGIKLL